MSCLHLVSLGADNIAALSLLESSLAATDGILLLGDGLSLSAHFKDRDQPVYLWSNDLPGGLNDDDVVTLTLTFDKTMSWHD